MTSFETSKTHGHPNRSASPSLLDGPELTVASFPDIRQAGDRRSEKTRDCLPALLSSCSVFRQVGVVDERPFKPSRRIS